LRNFRGAKGDTELAELSQTVIIDENDPAIGEGGKRKLAPSPFLRSVSPFRLGYLEALLRAADCRASAEEDQR